MIQVARLAAELAARGTPAHEAARVATECYTKAKVLTRLAEKECSDPRWNRGGRDEARRLQIEQRLVAILPGRVSFSHDPRGYTVRVHLGENGPSNSFDGEGWGFG